MAAPAFTPPTGLPTVFDPAYKGSGQKVGLEIFRIEKLKVVKKAPTDECYLGKLYSGDSYIILQTKMRENAFERHIFFWLGKDTSQDEYGCAAYKTVELDCFLGGEPVQHREVQGFETDQFVSLFKQLTYLEGGVATGFKHVDRDAFAKRLLHVKGRRNIRVMSVEVSPKSMNGGDVFILDAGRELFLWNGAESSNVEKQKALEIIRSIRDQERSGQAKISIIDEFKDDDKDFWAAMGCAKTKIQRPAAVSSDDDFSKLASKVSLYKISDSTGKLVSTEIKADKLTQDLLKTEDSYILDTGLNGIFAWIGKKASNNEKLHSMKLATDFIAQKKYPNSTPVTRVVEGGETPLFKNNFAVWVDPNATALGGLGSKKKTGFAPKKAFDINDLYTAGHREETRCVDDGNGKITIWRIEKFEKVLLAKADYGQFYSGDSYIILYTYIDQSKEKHIIYFWQGLNSSQDEKGASAALTTALDDEMGGEPVQCRVVQNKEPPHFYLMFKGKMVVHTGGKASGFKNIKAKDSFDTDGTRLYQIRGTTASNVRAAQVAERAASLNSGDVFYLDTPKGATLWCGLGASGDEREFGKQISKSIAAKEAAVVMEGKEPASFWEGLGGKTDYSTAKVLTEPLRQPRLFQCSNNKGFFFVEEVFDFDQEDLIEDDVMILDAYYEVFVWVGKGANTIEKKGALESATKYVNKDPTGRKEGDVVFMQVKQGFEPPNFTCHFFGFDSNKWSNGKTYEQLKAELKQSNPSGDLSPMDISKALSGFAAGTYSYSVLTGSDPLPEGLDSTKKEMYLNEAEFKQYMGCTKEEFAAMPAWKATGIKRKAKLY